MNTKNILSKLLLLLMLTYMVTACVESINEGSGTGSNGSEITIVSPAAGDTVQNGRNYITYIINEFPETGISYYEVINFASDTVTRFDQIGDDAPELFFEVDSSLIGSTIGYRVNFYDEEGNIGSGGEISGLYVKENNDPPLAPTGLQIVSKGASTVSLLWEDNSLRETGYRVYRKVGEFGSYTTRASLGANNISWNDYDLSENQVYYYKVAAYNQYGVSDESNEVNTSAGSASTTPKNVQAQALGASYVLLTWAIDNNTINGYIIQRQDGADDTWNQIAIIPAELEEYLDEGLQKETQYSYRVKSYTGSTQSSWSNSATVTTKSQDAYAPSNLVARFDSDNRYVRVTWSNNNASGEVSSTVVERRSSLGDGEFEAIASAGSGVNVFYDSVFSEETTYEYRTKFVTVYGFNTRYSETDTAYIPNLPPQGPSDLTITEFVFGQEYFLQWEDNSDEEVGFELYRRIGTGEFELYQTLPENSHAFTETNVTASNIYYYKVRSFTADETSEFSNIVSTAGGTGDVIKPTNLAGVEISGELKVQLTWEDNSDNELAFEIERKRDSTSNWAKILTVPQNTVAKVDSTNIERGSVYNYRVRAINTTGYSDYSNEITVSISF